METYRGYPVPEVVEEDGLYIAIDEKFGWFESLTATNVLLFWQNKVDTVLTLDALRMGLIERTNLPDDFACCECGLRIWDIFKHLEWHKTH